MRLHRLAAAASFAVALGAVVLGLVVGSATPAWLVTMWYPPGEAVEGAPLLPVLGGCAFPISRGGPGRYRLRLYTREGVDLILVYPARR
ncbi:hypothetical protein AB0G05_32455 [Nonomuraea wenchangensis]